MSNSGLSLIEDKVKCSCKGYNLDKLLQPNILTILAQQDLHGYMVIQALEAKSHLFREGLDNTGVYRALKTLEDKEMVDFQWVLEETGPAKKKYSITDKGLECLGIWIKTLEAYKNMIGSIIDEAREVLEEE